MRAFWLVILGALVLRLLVLPFTLKTGLYFSTIVSLYNHLHVRMRKVNTQFAADPGRAYAEEIHGIDVTLQQVERYKKPHLFVFPIAIQTLVAGYVLWMFLYMKNQVLDKQLDHPAFPADFLWFKDLALKDPYYVLPNILLIVLIIKFKVTLPDRGKVLLCVLALFLWIVILNIPAGMILFWTSLIAMSTTQTFLLNRRYKPLAIECGEGGPSKGADFDLDEWLIRFKKKAFLLVLDDVILSILLSCISIVPSLLYVGHFYWRYRTEWRSGG